VPLIQIQGVGKTFRDARGRRETVALEDVSLTVEEGVGSRDRAVRGRSGAIARPV
jgi:ABC-type methionine transport system ATPase subunit